MNMPRWMVGWACFTFLKGHDDEGNEGVVPCPGHEVTRAVPDWSVDFDADGEAIVHEAQRCQCCLHPMVPLTVAPVH